MRDVLAVGDVRGSSHDVSIGVSYSGSNGAGHLRAARVPFISYPRATLCRRAHFVRGCHQVPVDRSALQRGARGVYQ